MVEKIAAESKASKNNFNTWQLVSYGGKTKPIPKTTANSNANTNTNNKHNNRQFATSTVITHKTNNNNSSPLRKSKSVVGGGGDLHNTTHKRLAAHSLKHTEHSQPSTAPTKKSVGHTVSQQQQQQQHQQQLLVRRKRSNQQEIRQIKRAHRHLLTSGGNDKQQQQHCQTNSCSPSSSAALKRRTATAQKLKHSSGNKNIKEFHCKTPKVIKNSNNNSSPNAQSANKAKGKLKSTNAKHKKLNKRFTANDQDSIISSRWCSIEERLDLLEKLLYYCDEEENAALKAWYESINRKYLFDSSDNTSDDGDNDDNSASDWSWSDVMSSSSTSATAPPSEGDARSTISNNSLASSCASSLVPSSLKRRGHQHHPRFAGTRRPNVPPNVEEIIAALYKSNDTTTSELDASLEDSYIHYTDEPEDDPEMAQRIKASLNLPLTDSVTTSMGSNSPTPTDDSSMLDEGVASAQTPTSGSSSAIQPLREKKSKSKRDKADKNAGDSSKEKKSKRTKKDKSKRASACLDSTDVSITGDNASATADEGIAIDDDDVQSAEWAKLRCTSEAAEIVAERETRRNKNRCADYPGLAFGRSIFSSDTMMKFNIIRNELHNIMNTQLKRVIIITNAKRHFV